MPVNFDRSFDEIAIAMGRAANERSVAPASSVAERHGLIERGDGKPSQITIWKKLIRKGAKVSVALVCSSVLDKA